MQVVVEHVVKRRTCFAYAVGYSAAELLTRISEAVFYHRSH
jgi:hypothetical protein